MAGSMTPEERASYNEYMRNWRKNNKEHVNQYNREWRKNNPEKMRGYRRDYWGKKAAEREAAGNDKEK